MSLTTPERVWNLQQSLQAKKPEHLVRKPDAGKPPVRFDERDVETEILRTHRATSRLY